uniref:Uncharacterized protein n=1 Tax=Schistocephalus solidus TaxID=70667 RepID=A0A0X3P4I6_SCHSO
MVQGGGLSENTNKNNQQKSLFSKWPECGFFINKAAVYEFATLRGRHARGLTEFRLPLFHTHSMETFGAHGGRANTEHDLLHHAFIFSRQFVIPPIAFFGFWKNLGLKGVRQVNASVRRAGSPSKIQRHLEGFS